MDQKVANIKSGVKYTYDYIKDNPEVFDPTTFNENDNIGLVRGYGNIGVLDVDGIKSLGDEGNKELKKYLLKILETIDYPFIIQETQSGGYHCLYYTEDTVNFNLNNIFWPVERPDDFPSIIDTETYKENLSNKTLGSNIIEVFQDLNGYTVFAPSTTKNGEYKLLNDNYTWKQIIDKPIKHIENNIDAVFKNKGFRVETRKTKSTTETVTTTKNKIRNIYNLSDEGKEKLANLTSQLMSKTPVGTRHNVSFCLGGYFYNHIRKKDAKWIVDNISQEAIDHLDTHDEFKKTVMANYDRPDANKKTLSGIIEKNPNNKEVVRIVNDIANVIKPKKEIGTDIEEKVYEYGNKIDGSFLTAKSPVKYAINPKYKRKLKNTEKKLLKLFNKNDKWKIESLLNGGYTHFRLPNRTRVTEIYNPNNILSYKYEESGTSEVQEAIYGFRSIINAVKNNSYDDYKPYEIKIGNLEDNEIIKITTDLKNKKSKANKYIEDIKKIIKEMTILNPSYYACEGFLQINNELYTDKVSKIGFFAFKNIKKVIPFDPVKRQISNKQAYDLEIVTNDNKTITYENFVIEDLVKDLYHRGLLMEDGKKNIANIIKFLMETNKKQGLEIVKRAIVPGVFYDTNNNKLLYYLPELEVGKYTLKEGVEVMNDIFSRIFANKIKYSTIYLAGFIQLLCNVFKELGLDNGVNKHLLLLQASNALKSFVLDLNNHTFRHVKRFEETKTGDTKSAILRNVGKSTYPQILNDSKISINSKDFTDITLALTFGYVADEVANDQYGNKTNTRDAFRLLAVSHNEPNFTINDEGGEARRLNIAIFTHADRPTKEQKQAINEYLTIKNGDIKLNRLNAIGEAYIKFIVSYFEDFTTEKNQETYNTGGWNIIDKFLKYLEVESGVKLNRGFYNRYEWDDLTENESVKLRGRLRYNFEETLKNKGIPIIYDVSTVEKYFNLNKMFHPKKNKNKPISYVLHKDEFESFIHSPGGLGRNISAEDGLKLLSIDKKFKRLRYDTVNEANKDFRITCTPITPEEVLEAFYGEIVTMD